MDAVEFYHHSGVVSEYKCSFGTVRWSGIGWCPPQNRKIGSVSTLSVVVGEMFKRSRPRMVKGWPREQPLIVAATTVL